MSYCMGWVVAAVMITAMAGSARGELIYLELEDQTRWIRAQGKVPGQVDADVREATSPGLFDEYAEISLVAEDPGRWAWTHAYASQRSVLDRLVHRTQVNYDMSIGVAYQDVPGDREHVAVGESFFEVVFRLDQPHRYTFSAPRNYTFAPHPNGLASWHNGGLFTEDGEAIVSDFWFELVDQQGILPEGRYILRHHALIQSRRNMVPETEALRFSMELVALPLPPGAWAGLGTLAGLGAIAGAISWRRKLAERLERSAS